MYFETKEFGAHPDPESSTVNQPNNPLYVPSNKNKTYPKLPIDASSAQQTPYIQKSNELTSDFVCLFQMLLPASIRGTINGPTALQGKLRSQMLIAFYRCITAGNRLRAPIEWAHSVHYKWVFSNFVYVETIESAKNYQEMQKRCLCVQLARMHAITHRHLTQFFLIVCRILIEIIQGSHS